uniref:Uncharacterized protein n=1 Tax=Phytophthora ramorum TaxID=164328 RepID=H3GYX4_PHYRM
MLAKLADEIDSDAVDYDESDDALKPPSDPDDDSGNASDTSIKQQDLPVVRPFNHRCSQGRKRVPKKNARPLSQRERRRQEAKTKACLMKTMDNTHIRLVKNLNTSYEIFKFICENAGALHAVEGYPESTATKNERVLVATGPPAPRITIGNSANNVCLYCDRPRHPIHHCRGLLKDLRDDQVKAGTILPANFAQRQLETRPPTKNSNRACNVRHRNNDGDKRNRGDNRRTKNDNSGRGYDQRKRRDSNSGGDDSDTVDNRRKVFRQERRETGLIAVATANNPPLSLTI